MKREAYNLEGNFLPFYLSSRVICGRLYRRPYARPRFLLNPGVCIDPEKSREKFRLETRSLADADTAVAVSI